MATKRSETAAHAAFSDNMDRLTAVIGVFNEEWSRIATELKELNDRLRLRNQSLKEGRIDLPSKDELDKDQAIRSRSTSARVANEFMDEWHAVMLVTFTEAYLEDALAECAAANPDLMSKSEQAVNYAEVRDASSLDDLLDDIRHRWARNFVDDGGPGRWIDRLTRMGARGYEENDPAVLEELWGIRHVVVHSAGRVTRDFVRRHPGLGYSPGDPLAVQMEQLSEKYAMSIFRFVNVSDEFFMRRYLVD